MNGPKWSKAPRAGARAVAEIIRVMPGPGQMLVALAAELVGVWTHWNGRRTLPCTGDERDCWFDHRYTSSRWQGWLPVCKPADQRVRYLSLTANAVRDCPCLRPDGGDLRGRQLLLSRSSAGMEARMYCVDVGRVDDVRKLPTAPNVKAWLKGLWGPPSTWTGIKDSALRAALATQQDAWDKAFDSGSEVPHDATR